MKTRQSVGQRQPLTKSLTLKILTQWQYKPNISALDRSTRILVLGIESLLVLSAPYLPKKIVPLEKKVNTLFFTKRILKVYINNIYSYKTQPLIINKTVVSTSIFSTQLSHL